MDYEKEIFSGEELNGLWDFENYSYQIYDDYNTNDPGPWCNTENVMRFYSVFLPLLYTLTLLVGLVANGLVLAILCRMQRTWSITNIFMLHRSVADLLLLITLPFWAAEAVLGWTLGTILCKLMGAILKISFSCGIFLLVSISLDCYLSIVHAVQVYSCLKPWQVQASCLFIWFFCLILSIPDWVSLELIQFDYRLEMNICVHNYYQHARYWHLASRLLYHIMGFLIPSMVMIFCYSCIWFRLHRSSQEIQKRRTMRLILLLMVAFIICWMPYNVTLIVDTLHARNVIHMTCKSAIALDISIMVTTALGYMHCCLNPILYAIFGVKLQD